MPKIHVTSLHTAYMFVTVCVANWCNPLCCLRWRQHMSGRVDKAQVQKKRRSAGSNLLGSNNNAFHTRLATRVQRNHVDQACGVHHSIRFARPWSPHSSPLSGDLTNGTLLSDLKHFQHYMNLTHALQSQGQNFFNFFSLHSSTRSVPNTIANPSFPNIRP